MHFLHMPVCVNLSLVSTAIPVPSNDDDNSVNIYEVIVGVIAAIGALLLIINILLLIILVLYMKKRRTQEAQRSSNTNDPKSQQQTHTTAGVTSQGTDTIKKVNELTKAKSRDSALQHNNSRPMPTTDDYDDTIIPKLNLSQIIKRSKQEDYIEMDISGSIASDELYDDTVAGPAGDDSVNIEPNPSYCLEHIGRAVKLEENPSYNLYD